jgi:DNA-binding PadR family transcriptional regulator
MSASEVVLGLVIEHPGGGYHVAQRLNQRLASTNFAEPTIQRALRRLQQNGYVCLAEGKYEATPDGIEHFRRWLAASTPMPPVREELHAKIALCGPHDLPRLIEVIREAELACTAKLAELNRRTRRDREQRAPQGWQRRMSVIIEAGDIAWWEGRIKWLQDVRTELMRERDYGEIPQDYGPLTLLTDS